MRVLRKFLVTFAAVIVAMASGVLVAHADSTPSVYNTPGGQISDGRLWNTTCEKYSSNVVRCRAEIWATTVQYRNGKYERVKGWTFNNLSYLPSSRALWARNDLGRTNNRWVSDARTWRTECDTPATGRGGCRSYIWTKRVREIKQGSGWRYVNESAWVFNNLVLFSSKSIPAVKQVPAWIIDQSRLDVTGLTGTPIQVGASMKDLETLGYFKYEPDKDGEFPWFSSQSLANRGVWAMGTVDNRLRHVEVDVKGIRTVDGAQVGMTLGQIKAIYGNRLRLEVKQGHWDMYTAVVQSGGNELVFWNTWDRPLVDSDVINFIRARKISPDLF